MLQVLADHPSLRVSTSSSSINDEEEGIALKLLSLMERNAIAYSSRGDSDKEPAITPSVMELIHRGMFPPSYVAFHIRRGDFQQTQTRQSAEKIVEQTNVTQTRWSPTGRPASHTSPRMSPTAASSLPSCGNIAQCTSWRTSRVAPTSTLSIRITLA